MSVSYTHLDVYKRQPESIHLCDFPEYDEKLIDKELENDMEEVLDIVVPVSYTHLVSITAKYRAVCLKK